MNFNARHALIFRYMDMLQMKWYSLLVINDKKPRLFYVLVKWAHYTWQDWLVNGKDKVWDSVAERAYMDKYIHPALPARRRWPPLAASPHGDVKYGMCLVVYPLACRNRNVTWGKAEGCAPAPFASRPKFVCNSLSWGNVTATHASLPSFVFNRVFYLWDFVFKRLLPCFGAKKTKKRLFLFLWTVVPYASPSRNYLRTWQKWLSMKND